MSSLKLEYADLSDMDFEAHSIESLSLKQSLGLQNLDKFSELKSLTINRCSYTDHIDTIRNIKLKKLNIAESVIDIRDLLNLNIGELGFESSKLRNIESLNEMDLHSLEIKSPINFNNLSLTQQSITKLILIDGLMNNLIPIKDLINLDYLHLQGMRLNCLESIDSFSNLTHVNINNNRINDITPLSSLKHLQYLNINANSAVGKIKCKTAIELLDMGIAPQIMNALLNCDDNNIDCSVVDEMKAVIASRSIKSA